jgi:head-tail adaptor
MGVLGSLLNNTFSVDVPNRISDGQGGHTIVYADGGTIQGRMRPANSNERVVADSEEQQITHVLYTAMLSTSAGETLARGCRVTLGDLVVEVLGVREPSEADHHWEIDCLERQYELQQETGS